MTEKRVIGVDFGDTRTGLAVSDASGFLAGGLCTLKANGMQNLANKITRYCDEYNAVKIVIGCPFNMDGTLGPRAEKAERFAEILRETSGREVELFDERLTTVSAAEYLNATDTRGKKRKSVIDTLSAQIILQDWLDLQNANKDKQDK